MDGLATSTEACPRCRELAKDNQRQRKYIEQLLRRNQVVNQGRIRDRRTIRRLQSTIARLEDQLKEARGEGRPTAANSSLPPSANPIGEPCPVKKKPTGRLTGAQKGHPGHGRKLLPAQKVDQIVAHRPTHCAHCQAALPQSLPGQVVARHQQAELPPVLVTVTEHQALAYTCPACGGVSRGVIPPAIVRSVCGPRLTAALGHLSARALVSRRDVQELLSVLLGFKLSLGSVFARERELSEALAGPYEQLNERARDESVRYVDETGWKRAMQWLWVAATPTVVVFLCCYARTFAAVKRLLGGKLVGWICTDRFGVYDRWPKKRRGLCWAHLKRDFQRLLERGGFSGKLGAELLALTREVFHRWRWFVRGKIGRPTLQRELKPLRGRIKRLLQRGAESGIEKTAGLCRRLLKLQGPMWRFAQVEGLEPTNNLAERMLRRAVMWRKKSFGSHSQDGCRFVERMLSVIQTLELRGRDVLEYLAAAVAAHREGRAAPAIG